jgi:hypothetical protein
MNAFDLSALRTNKKIIKYIFDVVKKRDFLFEEIYQKRSNFFHYSAKKNECFPIVIYKIYLKNLFKTKNDKK